MKDRFESFASLVLELNRCVQKIKEIELKEFNLKGTHGMCLYYLYHNPCGLTPAELTNLVKEDKAAISRALKTLLEKELVKTVVSENSDKRNYRNPIQLTETGVELAKTIDGKIDNVLSLSDNLITEKERIVMYSSLKKITGNLSAYIDEASAR